MSDPTATIFEPSLIKCRDWAEIGPRCIVGQYAIIMPRTLRMLEGSQVSPGAIISGGGTVILGKYSVVGFRAILISATDSRNAKFMCEAAREDDRDIIRGSITLLEGAYIGSGAIICVSRRCPDIVIGERTIIGAGCYIDRSIPDGVRVRPEQNLIIEAR